MFVTGLCMLLVILTQDIGFVLFCLCLTTSSIIRGGIFRLSDVYCSRNRSVSRRILKGTNGFGRTIKNNLFTLMFGHILQKNLCFISLLIFNALSPNNGGHSSVTYSVDTSRTITLVVLDIFNTPIKS